MQAQLSSELPIVPAPSERLAGIQILRAVAALCVVYAHLADRNVKRGFTAGTEWWNADLGHLGVCVFFAISGYVMILASARAFAQDRKGHEALLFFKRRLLRICPLYYLTTIAYIAFELMVWKRLPAWGDVAKSFLFIPYRNEADIYQPVYGLGWSLNYEMFFYLLMAVAIVLPRKRGLMLVGTVITCLLAIGVALGPDPASYGGSAAGYFYTRPELFYFLAGLLAATLPVYAAERRIAAAPGLAAAVTLIGGLMAYRYQKVEWASAIGAFVVIRALSHHHAFSHLGTPLRRFLAFLGDASYSLYLTHSFVLGAVTILIARLVQTPWLATVLSLIIGFAVAIVTAIIAYVGIERPLIRAASRFMTPRSSAAAALVDTKAPASA